MITKNAGSGNLSTTFPWQDIIKNNEDPPGWYVRNGVNDADILFARIRDDDSFILFSDNCLAEKDFFPTKVGG